MPSSQSKAEPVLIGRIPLVAEAVANPIDYEVCHSVLGWTLADIDGKIALCITAAEAEQIIKAQTNWGK